MGKTPSAQKASASASRTGAPPKLRRSHTFRQLPSGRIVGGKPCCSFSQGHRQLSGARLSGAQGLCRSMLPGRVRPLTALQLDPVLQGLADLQRMFGRSAAVPVRVGTVPPNGTQFAIHFPDDFLEEHGNIMVEINKKGWPLGHPLSTELHQPLSHPEQQKLGRQRQALLRSFREETTGTGSLLETRASKVAGYSIWETGHGMRYFEWVNQFPCSE